MGITAATVLGAHRVTITGAANSRVTQVLGWVSVEEGPAELTVGPHCVVLTCITHASTHIARCQVHGHVKMAAVGVPMALALLAGMTVAILGWTPGQVMIEILTLLAVEALSVVFADTGPMNHALSMRWCPGGGCTLGGVSVAETVASNYQFIQGVVVLLSDLPTRVEQVVPQRVQPCQVHPQVGDLQQVLDLWTVGV